MSAKIVFRCPGCDARIKAPVELLGQRRSCPGCKTPMHVKTVEPLKNETRLDEIVYECPSCGTETRRNVAH